MQRRQNHTLFVLAGTLAAFAPSTAVAGAVIAPGWGTPIFEDQFEGGNINWGVWQVADWPGEQNNESQYYHPGQVSVQDGVLRLRADRDPSWRFGREYNSGLVRSWEEWSYGRVEVRAKLPYGQGFWPAIWLLPRTAPWPAGGEIDIMEARGDLPWRMSSALHWGWDAASRQYASQAYESGANFQAGFHDYAVEWEVGTVRFYVDGVEHYRLYEPAVGIPGTPKSIVLNLAVGGDYSGYPDWTTPFPSNFEIDYVRVWQRPEWVEPPSSLILDPGFEDSDGAMDAWPRFGNTIDNVTSDWGTPRDGARSLKMYGQFTGAENYSGALQNFPISGGERLTAGAYALTRSEDSIVGTDNQALLKIEFYSEAGAEYGSEYFLDESLVVIADSSSPEDTWTHSELAATAPLGAVEARVAIVFRQPASNPGGAVFVDSVTLTSFCPADVTTDAANPGDPDAGAPDGLVTVSDLSYFVEQWLGSNASVADLTTGGTNPGDAGFGQPDGEITTSDLTFYVEQWIGGCP
ncbi:MAG: glycoside hydrolase family 16 protein [Planctomycetota bacterium]